MKRSTRMNDFGCKTFELLDGSKLLQDEYGCLRIIPSSGIIAEDVHPHEVVERILQTLERKVDEQEDWKAERKEILELLEEVHSLLTWKFPGFNDIGVDTYGKFIQGQIKAKDEAAKLISEWVHSSNKRAFERNME